MLDFHKENDQNFTWTDLNVYSAAIYAFGDLNCHNKHERSWSVNGNQMRFVLASWDFAGLALGGSSILVVVSMLDDSGHVPLSLA